MQGKLVPNHENPTTGTVAETTERIDMRNIFLASVAAFAFTVMAVPADAGVGSAAADENFGTLDGISAFDSLAGIQANPLGTNEVASITVAHFLKKDRKTGNWLEITTGHYSHYSHGHDHGVKGPDGGGRMVEYGDTDWESSGAKSIHFNNP